jgi:hypothetical protein
MIQLRVSEAEEQLGMVREVLDSDGIAEASHSDTEYTSEPSSPPRAMDYTCPDGSDEDSDSESAPESPELSSVTMPISGQMSLKGPHSNRGSMINGSAIQLVAGRRVECQ